MNCSRFRFLIQQRFDMDIAPQDERMVGAHLESCESCAKFHHQLQQVIMAAEEVPLPDEMSPSPPEALARNIMEGLPQPKVSPFDFITKLFAKKEKELPTSIDRGGDRGGSQTKFPHVNRGAQAGDGAGMGMDAPRKEMAMPTGKQKDEDHSGTSNRLRALAKGPVENREAQSTTRSLGEKLGFAAPAGGSLTDDQPLTLAESIRRKISEKPPEAEEEEMTMAPPVPPQPAAVDDSWGNPASTPSRAPANMASPPNIPGNRPQPAQISGGGQPEGQTVLGSWGKPSPIENSNSWGGQQNAAAAQSMSRDDWNFDANANQQGAQQMAPQARGGSIDPFAAPGQATSNPNMQAPSADSWGGWNEASAPKGASAGEGDSDWGPPPAGGAWDEPTAASAPSNSWGGTPSPAQPPKPISAVQAQAQFGAGVMETGMIKLGELGLPSMPGQQPGGPGVAPQPGGAPPFPQPAQQAPGTAADASSPWGSAPSTPAAPQGGAADPWGSSGTDSWGPSTSQNAWGTTSSPENQIPAGAGNQWGQPSGQPAQAADPFGGGGAPAGDWGEPAGAPTDSWSGGAPGGQGNWNQPAAMPGGSWDQPGSDANSQPAWGESNDWSQGAQQAPPAVPEPQQGSSSQAAALGKGRQQAWSLEAEQVETGTWRAFAPSGEALSSAPAQARGQDAAQPASTPGANQQSFAPQQDEQSRWDIPIQERMQKQSSPSIPNLPQTPVAPPSPFAQPAFNQAQAAAAAPMAPPQPQPVKPQEPLLPSDSPAPTKSGWNFPVYEAPDQLTAIPAEPKVSNSWDSPVSQPAQTGLGGSWGEPPAPPTPMEQPKVSGAWDMPSAPSFSQPALPQPVQPLAPMPGQPGASVPIDSIMDRLGNVLNNNAEVAPAQAQPSSQWDVSIQERQQQAAAAAAAAAPQQPQPPTSPWGQGPEPAAAPAMPGNGGGWGAPPQPLPTQPQAPAPVGNSPWDSPPVALTPPPNPFALPQQQPQSQQAPAASGWDSPMGQSPIGNPAQPLPLPVPQPAVAAAPGPQPAAPSAPGGLFQNLDDNAIDRLFSENLGVSDSGAAAAAAAPVQQAPAPAFTAPRWNPGENGGGGAPAQPSFSAPTQPTFGAPPQPFGAQPAATADAGGPKISAITPRSAAPPEPAPMPGMDRRNQSPFAMPGAAPQTMAPPQPMASPFAQPEPIPVAAAVAPPSQKNGLFDLDDSAMDELFSKNLGVNEQATPSNQAGQPQQAAAPVFQSPPVMAQQQQPPAPPANPFSRPAPQMAPSMPNPFAPLSAPPQQPEQAPLPQPQAQPAWGQQPPAPPTLQQPPQQQGGLFSIDDSMIDKIFADNAAPQPPQPVAAPQFNVNEAVREFAEVAQNVPPPKIAGVGRLDSRTDTTADAGSGRIASIGKFLLDQKDLEKIGKLTGSDLSETKMRILTMEAAQELQTLLQHIGTQETVIGSVIVGHDGLLIANTMPPDIDAESMGVWALGLYMSTEMVIKKMGQDRVHQIVSRTPKGYVVIADFGGGLLVTVSDGKDTDTLIPLMRSITQLVAQ